jgi:hypothetical protein
LFILIQNWPDAGQYGIPPFVKLYEGVKGYILHDCCWCYDLKIQVNAGLPGKKLVRHQQL